MNGDLHELKSAIEKRKANISASPQTGSRRVCCVGGDLEEEFEQLGEHVTRLRGKLATLQEAQLLRWRVSAPAGRSPVSSQCCQRPGFFVI